MTIKTNYRFNFKQYFLLTVVSKSKKILIIILGRIVNKLLSFEKSYRDNISKRNLINVEKTSFEKIETMSKPAARFNPSLKDYGGLISKDLNLRNNIDVYNVYDLCAKTLHNFIDKNSSEIKKVVQIGCGALDIINEYLSSKFENIKFISNDLMIDLEEIHTKEFDNFKNKKNWECLAGYQIDLLKENSINGDLVFSKSILCAHSPKELDELFNLYKKNNFKFIFISEKWHPNINNINIFKLDRPENVNKNQPYINGYFHHNYFNALDQNGYDVISSDIYVVKNSKNKNFNLNYYLFIFAKLK